MPARVNFLMPVASPAPYLKHTLASINEQTFSDWGLTAVIDGHSPDVEALIGGTIPAERLTLVRLPESRGISRALNAGLEATRSGLVARVDADDVNLAGRLDRQVRFMDSHPEVLAVGGSALLIDAAGDTVGELAMPHGSDIRRDLLLRNRLVHSSVVFRRDVVAEMGGYNARCVLREDYELWLRLAAVGPIANLEGQVVKYRLNEGQISRRPMPASSGAYVSAARLDAAQSIGTARLVARGMNLAWVAAQNEAVKARFGAFSRQRRRSGRDA